METVRIELPPALLRAANLEGKNLSQEAARLLALELYREDKVSLERAAELCQTPLAAFMDFAAEHGVPPPRYSYADLEEERRSTDPKGDRRSRFIAAGYPCETRLLQSP
jgi:predicted HTH domain antitoxin